MLAARLESFGSLIVQQLDGFGRFLRFTWSVLHWLVTGPGKWGRLRLLVPQLFQIGTMSIPVMILVGAFVGMVLAVEAFAQFEAIGQEARLGGVINISVVKQIGPVLAAVMLAGRIGSSVSAELGTMRVTEQLDAMRAMGADPVPYLVVPRVLACVLMIPVLTVFSDVMGIFGGYAVTVRGFGVNSHDYWAFSREFVENWDILTGLTKSVFFGLLIGLISCYKGFHCGSGAEGVGRAATDAFVTSFIAIIVANFFLAKFLNDVYLMIFGASSITAFG